jgi:hypothetical protein
MRFTFTTQIATRLAVLSAALILGACRADETPQTAPELTTTIGRAFVPRCSSPDQVRAGMPPATSTFFGDLPGQTITATFRPFTFSSFWVFTYSFSLPGMDDDALFCIGSPAATFQPGPPAPVYAATPTPAGVDAAYWTALPTRVQHALSAYARSLAQSGTIGARSESGVINDVLRPAIELAEFSGQYGAQRFVSGTIESELLAAGIMAAELHAALMRQSVFGSDSDAIKTMVAELLIGFGEARYQGAPLRALQYGRNVVVGAAVASRSPQHTDLPAAVFAAVGPDGITITDPYTR